jgi:hypothetical protein
MPSNGRCTKVPEILKSKNRASQNRENTVFNITPII